MKQKIILASTSPRRSALLKQIGLNFEIMPSRFEEDMSLKLSHAGLAEFLAYGKAKEVAGRIKSGVVIGSDTFLVFNKKRIGKPKGAQDARRMLKMISGKNVMIYSGVAIVDIKKGRAITDHEITKVKIKKLSPKEISDYVKTGEPLDKAGAFAIQGAGAVFIEKINGCYSNVIGLPLYNLYKNLKKIGVDVF